MERHITEEEKEQYRHEVRARIEELRQLPEFSPATEGELEFLAMCRSLFKAKEGTPSEEDP